MLGAAELVDLRQALLERLLGVVEELRLVGGAGDAAFGAGAVVGDDHDQRVVELADGAQGTRAAGRCGDRCGARKPANTSIIRLYSRRSSADSESHSGTSGSWRDSSASAGTMPSSFCRANTFSR